MGNPDLCNKNQPTWYAFETPVKMNKDMKQRTLILLITIATFFSIQSKAANNAGVYYQIPTAEYNALVDLYSQAGGSGWKNSNSGWLNQNATSWYMEFHNSRSAI